MLSSLAPARRRLVLALIGVLVAALLVGVVILVTNIVTRKDPARAAAIGAQQPGPVVLVPGYGGSRTGLDQLAQVLRRNGKDATVVSLPDSGRGDLDAQASALDNQVASVLDRTHASSVDLIGYSAGGVVTRLWIREHGGAALARRVITLGSPHHGTDVATLAGTILPSACPTACRQLATTSTLLAALNSGDETPNGPTYVSIWTAHDRVVVPVESPRLQGALDFTVQSVCPSDTVDHGGLPTDPNVASMVLRELRAGAPQPLTRVDCGTPAG